jgi:hypothetical protein
LSRLLGLGLELELRERELRELSELSELRGLHDSDGRIHRYAQMAMLVY